MNITYVSEQVFNRFPFGVVSANGLECEWKHLDSCLKEEEKKSIARTKPPDTAENTPSRIPHGPMGTTVL